MLNAIINIFKPKYTVVILNSKWEILEKNLKLVKLPRQKEYIWNDIKYYQVINVIHSLQNLKQITIIVEEIGNAQVAMTQAVTK